MNQAAAIEPMAPSENGTARWYVVETKQHRESVVRELLRQKGVQTYLPMLRSPSSDGDALRIGPLFPSYLFVRSVLPDEFATVAWTPGVKGFIPIVGGPIALEDVVVDYLRSQEDTAGVVRAPDQIVPNGEVVLVAGPWRGLPAVVERSLPARERVRILIEVMHRRTPIEVPRRWLRPS